MILGDAPSERAAKTCEMFWNLVSDVRRDGDCDDTRLAALALAKYLLNHGGYFRLTDTVMYLAKSAAVNSSVERMLK